MKSLFVTFSLLLFSVSAIAQYFEDGRYAFTDEYSMDVAIEFTENGETISNVNINDGPDVVASNGTGFWFKVNMQGVEEDYNGPEGWYQFETGEGETYEMRSMGNGKYKLMGPNESITVLTFVDNGPVEMTEGGGHGSFEPVIDYDWHSEFYGLCFESADGTTLRIDTYGADTFIGRYDESVSTEDYEYSITMYLICVAGIEGNDLPVSLYIEVEGAEIAESDLISLDFETYVKFRGKDFKVVNCE
jgi:hypothetical protein